MERECRGKKAILTVSGMTNVLEYRDVTEAEGDEWGDGMTIGELAEIMRNRWCWYMGALVVVGLEILSVGIGVRDERRG